MGASAGAERAHPVLLPAAASAHHRTAAAPRGAHHPGYPTALGCQCCQEESAVSGTCARAPHYGFLMAAVNFPCVNNSRGAGSALDLLTACRGYGSLEERHTVSCPSRCLRLWQCWGLGRAHGCKVAAQACSGNEQHAATAASGRGPGVSTRQPCSHLCGHLVLTWSLPLPEPRLVLLWASPVLTAKFWCWFVSCQSCWC